jgi:hypothetical protein
MGDGTWVLRRHIPRARKRAVFNPAKEVYNED